MAIALTGLAVLLAPVVASFFGLADEAGLFRLGSLNLLAVGLGNIQDSVLRRELHFRRRAIPQVLRAVVRAVVSISLAVAGYGAEALMIGVLSGTAAWTISQWVVSSFRPKLALDRQIIRSMFVYGGTSAMLQVLSVIATRIDVVAIGRALGERALGLYSIAFRLPELLIDSIAWNISVVAFPALSRTRVHDEQGLGDATLLQLRYQALYALPMATGLAILALPLITVLFTSTWAPAAGVLSAIAVGSGMVAVAFPLGDVFKAIGKQGRLVAFNLVSIPTLITVIVLLAPLGITAVAWGRTAMMSAWAVFLTVAVARSVHIQLSRALAAVRPAIVASAGVAVGAGVVRLTWTDASILPLLAGTAAGIAGALLALRLLNPDTLRELRAVVGEAVPRLRAATGTGS
jgi:PST family polysaccharide transporter